MTFVNAVLVTLSASILVGISALVMVDGFEWALLSLLGLPANTIYVIMAVSGLPVLFWVAKFSRGAWASVRNSAEPDKL